ncbi:MAG: response regulator, partial [Bacteroidales bacterium]|nr:response regulator [Bacteroidales bacterium]
RIWIDSSKEEGTSFRFVIPYEEIPKVDGESIEVDEINADEKNDWRDKVVLIVDDEEVNVMFLEAVIENTNAKTLYAKNGFEAVELCKNIPKIDLVLMDIVMPGMNGINATHEIRKFNTRVPIIAQTALNEEDDHRNCLEAGCNATITKPIEVEKLLMLMKRLLNDEI